MAFHIVLVEPEIPANTGNISRTCAATGTWLHLVRPLGFDTDDRTLKRAGLDYWHAVKLEYHDSFAEVKEKYKDARVFLRYDESGQAVHGHYVPRRRFSGIRQRNKGAGAGNFGGASRCADAHANDRCGALAEFIEFRSDYFV